MKVVLAIVAVVALTVSIPIGFAADFNGDGTNDIGIFRPASGLWAIRGVTRVYFGSSGDEPEPGDYNGDGNVEIGIFRPSRGLWAVRGETRVYFGGSSDEPLAAASGGGFWHRNGNAVNYHGSVAINTQTASNPLTVYHYSNALVQCLSLGCGSTYYDGFISGLSSTMNAYLWNYEAGDLILGSNNQRGITIDAAGYVGIVNPNPSYPLDLKADNYGDYVASFENTNTYLTSSIMRLKTTKTDPGFSTDFISFHDSGGEISTIRGDGGGGIEIESQASPLRIRTSASGNFAARFFNDGGTSLYYGIRIQSGSDTGVGSSNLVMFCDGDGTPIGDITFTGGNVSYNNFTAEHTAKLTERENEKGYPYGTVVSLIAKYADPERPRQDNYIVQSSSRSYDKEVFGVYAGKHIEEENKHSIYAIGDGHILVTREGGDIESGDYLTTSGKAGHAMKQNDDLRHSYTVAKALEPVDWENEESDSKLIGCTYQTQ